MKMTRLTLMLSLLVVFLIIGCTYKDAGPVNADPSVMAINSCVGCHTNYTELKTNYTPDPPSDGGGGCGGEAPHIEPYDRVHIGGTGADEFFGDIHGQIECTYCHKGVDGTSDRNVAHSGDFVKKPSLNPEESCGSCHPTVVSKAKNSLHEQGWGQKSMVTLRSGLGTGMDKFAQLSEMVKEGYNTNCAKCHGTCGDCHINKPSAGGGGLFRGHAFNRTPDMRENCVACHVSRGGHAYFGEGIGTVPDVHLTKARFTCMQCHTANEVHGDGNYYDQRYKMALLPKCENCHNDIAGSNEYHTAHLETFNCQTCHSQDYNNCGSCHIHGDGARVPSYMGYKIGMNPIPETKPYKYATLRRSLMAPDSWELYGVSNLPAFDVRPTYKYSTPHNILKRTDRTTVDAGKPCYDACHIIQEGTEFRNKGLYLFESDLEAWEVAADQNIIVNGKLPSSWNITN